MKKKIKFKPTEKKMFSGSSSKMKKTEIGMIPEDWEVKELNEVASYITEKINLNEITITNFISTENMLPEKRGITLSSSLPKVGKVTQFKEGDILFSNIRTYFKKLWLAKFPGGCSNDVLVIRKKSLMNDQYLYYYLSQDTFFEFTVLTSKGTKMPRGDKNSIMSYEINIPPISEQSTIAKILSDLDSKIELNQQMNKNLEAIGQTIFKRWFVDFEFPDEKGKPYKSSGGEMVDSELGEIPKGWKVSTIGDCMEFAYGRGLPETTRQEGSYPVLGSNGIIGFHSDYLVKGPGIVIGRKGTLGEVYWIENNFFPIDTTFYIVDKMNVKPLYFHYFVLKGKEFLKSSSDSAVPGLNRNSAYSQSIIIPSEAIISKFNVFCQSLFNKKNSLSVQSNGLSQIRDSLLPKLMSGKIRVPQNEA